MPHQLISCCIRPCAEAGDRSISKIIRDYLKGKCYFLFKKYMNCRLTHLLKSTCHKDDLYPTRVGYQAAVATSLIIRFADQHKIKGNINTAAMKITSPFLTFRLQFQHGPYFLFCKFLQVIKRTHAENSKTRVHSMWKKALQKERLLLQLHNRATKKVASY